MKQLYISRGRPMWCLKKTNVLLFLFLISGFGFSQGMYTWMNGTSTADQYGVYGTQGTGSTLNTPGGRESPVTWKDASGNLWLFGGYGWDDSGNEGFLNDLWKYDVSTNEWTWVRGSSSADPMGAYGTLGVSSVNNDPGGREAASGWVDASGNFWMFGGLAWDDAFNLGEINDLWKYNVSTNEWTWMSGSDNCYQSATYGTMGTAAPSNIPGARFGQVTWFDATGNLWLHGGLGDDGSGNFDDLNDLWKYNISSGQWTWMNGSNTIDQNGTYGTINVAAASNVPGARWIAQSWTDNSGNLWLFGGSGYDASAGYEDFLNDLWRFNPSTGQWTWMSGSTANFQSGVYGTMGLAAATNVPGSRAESAGYKDSQGNLILFSGEGLDATGNEDYLNDLWKFDVSTNQWTWLNGSNAIDATGIYGVQGTPSITNMPGARGLSSIWPGTANNLWIFGGNGIDDSFNVGELNDLWKFAYCNISPTVSIASTTSTLCVGSSATLTASGATTYLWSNTQTNSLTVISPTLAGITTISVTPMDVDGCIGSNTVNVSITVYARPNPTLTASSTSLCLGGSTTITAIGAPTYSWSNNQTSSVTIITPSVAGITTISVTPTSSNGCVGTGTNNISITVYGLPTATVTVGTPAFCLGASTSMTATGATSYSWSNSQTGAAANITPAVSGVNTVTVYPTSNGCSGVPTTVTVNVYALPSLTTTSSKPDICMGETVTLNASGATSYSWVSASGLTTPAIVVTPTSTTVYTVTGMDSNGCKSTAEITQTVSACTGIAQLTNPGVEYKVYPNPNNGDFIIEGSQFGNATQLEIYNLLGQKVNVQLLTTEKTNVKTDLPKGLYTYRVIENDNVLNSGKVVIE